MKFIICTQALGTIAVFLAATGEARATFQDHPLGIASRKESVFEANNTSASEVREYDPHIPLLFKLLLVQPRPSRLQASRDEYKEQLMALFELLTRFSQLPDSDLEQLFHYQRHAAWRPPDGNRAYEEELVSGEFLFLLIRVTYQVELLPARHYSAQSLLLARGDPTDALWPLRVTHNNAGQSPSFELKGTGYHGRGSIDIPTVPLAEFLYVKDRCPRRKVTQSFGSLL